MRKDSKISGEPNKLRRRRRFSIAPNSAARHILFGGGGVAHSRLAAAFGGSGVYAMLRSV